MTYFIPNRRFWIAALVLAIVLLVLALPVFAQDGTPPAEPFSLQNLMAELITLAGVGGLMAAVVNVGKTFGIVKDGTAGRWSAGLNFIALGVLYAIHVFQPDKAPQLVGTVDQVSGTIAQISTLAVGLYFQLRSAQWGHETLKGLPLVGKSHSAVK